MRSFLAEEEGPRNSDSSHQPRWPCGTVKRAQSQLPGSELSLPFIGHHGLALYLLSVSVPHLLKVVINPCLEDQEKYAESSKSF